LGLRSISRDEMVIEYYDRAEYFATTAVQPEKMTLKRIQSDVPTRD